MPKVKILKDLSHPDYGFLEEGDVVIVFSNGGFDGIHAKLLERL